ncbi:hypothetical protein HYFRA_00003025 [Hymenoscyphus fraxineus]|uniref:Cytochrome P450 n=1 Tax=Hymenoscyphus fraxineus TaxID=746836 RepID=A0A9N9PFS9_9HELO|nr:hypothetical protein HYFRA_00003025 [Hymenoscyphus fraxineus]
MDEMLDHCITGQLPTSIIVTYVVWELTQNPEWTDRLHHELSKLSVENKLGGNSLSPPAVGKLPILNAVVMETHRVYSSNPGPWPRINLTRGPQLGERYYIPAGTTVGASSYALHRNEKIFPQPNHWHPRRWLDADARQLSDMNRWFWAFGSGPCKCLGSHFAVIVIKSVIKVIYTDFKAEIVDDSGIAQVDAPIASLSGDKLLVKFVPAEKRG